MILYKSKILIVDDEEHIRNIIKEYIGTEYDVFEASNGLEGIELFRENEYSLVILDIMMPKMDGWSVCREIRKISDIPIIMLSARGEEYDKIFGFQLGVDDYIVKPFSPKELLVRIKAIIRRTQKKTSIENTIELEGIKIEFDSRNVYVEDERASLTPKEYDLLKYLIENQNKVFTREQLLMSIWGYDFMGDDRTVDTHVKSLRESLKVYRKYIKTVWGVGYKWEV